VLKSILTIVGGSAVSLLITIIASPILTRLYKPEDFGLVASILAPAAILAVIAPGRLGLAIPIAKSEQDARDLFWLGTLSCLLMVPLLTAGTFLFVDMSIDRLTTTQTFFALLVITFFASEGEIVGFWRNRRKRFAFGARNGVIRSIAVALSQWSLHGITHAGMLLGNFVGGIFATALSWAEIYRCDKARLAGLPSRRRLKELLVEYRDFPLFSMPQGLTAAINQNAVPLLLLWLAGSAVAGQYWLVFRMLVAPINILGGAYRQVMLSHLGASEGKREEDVRLVRQHILVLTAMCIPAVTLGLFFGEQLFRFAFGDQWQLAGVFASWLALGFAIDLVKVPANCLLQRERKHHAILVFDIIAGILRAAALVIGYSVGGEVFAIQCFACANLVVWTVFILWAIR
jgi:O-antigen/teichoic acid export membrane protein